MHDRLPEPLDSSQSWGCGRKNDSGRTPFPKRSETDRDVNFSALFHDFWELTTTGLAQGSIYALFALGYTLVYGVLRLINFAHSEVFMLGTFGAVLIWNFLGLNQNSPTPAFGNVLLYLLAGLVVAALVSAVAALMVELVAYRPLRRRNAPPLAFLITAIGASIVLSEAVG